MYSGFMPDDKLILVGRIMVLVCVIFSAPLLHYPCRKGKKNDFYLKLYFNQGLNLDFSLYHGSLGRRQNAWKGQF